MEKKQKFLNVVPKIPRLGTKNALFWYFWDGIWKQYRHIENQHPSFYRTEKFHETRKMLKFGIKNALIRYFWARIFLKILFPYFKSARSNLPYCKISWKNKNAWICDQNTLFGYFWDRIRKLYYHSLTQHSRIYLSAKFREIIKMSNFGIKNALFRYFSAKNLKSCCHIWNAKFYKKTP